MARILRLLPMPAGDVYVGEFSDNLPNGQGTFTFANGDVYVGEWLDAERSGQGTYISANGTVRNGIWLKGAFIVANDIPPKCFESDYKDCE